MHRLILLGVFVVIFVVGWMYYKVYRISTDETNSAPIEQKSTQETNNSSTSVKKEPSLKIAE